MARRLSDAASTKPPARTPLRFRTGVSRRGVRELLCSIAGPPAVLVHRQCRMSSTQRINESVPDLPDRRRAGSLTLLRSFDVAREKVIAGWLRIAFFTSILFNHTVLIRYEFLDERMWIVWAQMLRDFGAVGFFLIAGTSLRGKVLANDRVKLPSNLLKLAIAAAALAAFDMLFTLARGGEAQSLEYHFYFALYETNLWFFIAYAFAGPLLLSLDRRGVFWTWVCCLLFIMFPADTRLLSPYILQTISLAFVCMAIGMELHGRQANPVVAFAVAAVFFVARVWLDDHGEAVYPSVDIVLRIAYGTACFLLFKSLADRLCHYARPPGWTNNLFVPYLIQVPLVQVVTVVTTMLYMGSVRVNMRPIFFSFWDSLGFMLTIFAISMIASLTVAWLLRRFRIRV